MKNPIAGIIFIDDDTSILKSLENLLKDEDWSCYFAKNGAQALDILQTKSIDLVVSEVELSDYDGIQLHTEIRGKYPEIVRLFLTSHANQQNVTKALVEGYTQQIIPKPWIDQELKEILHSALRQKKQQRQHSIEFQTLINSVPLMPALPESYSNVRSCITGDEINIEKMANYISQDVAISTALLHWANSALFGQRFQVDTIKKAIIVLGTDIVENLILSESINKTIAGQLPEVQGFDFQQFKKHSMATAVISRLLIKAIHCSDMVKHDRAFVSGLLHDMGKLAAASFFPKQFEKAIAIAKKRNCSLMDAEMKAYGSHHAELGSFLAEWWALPPFIVNAINWHHQPKSTPVERDVIAAAHVADLLSYQFNYGASDEFLDHEIDQDYRDQFYLSDEAIEIIKAETDKTIMSLVR
jgi:HD-like signal output (HDOD) protein/CheY-like chemotaxis protein